MLIFHAHNPKKRIVFIHIPKNSGKYIRQCIKNKYNVIKSFWDVSLIDRAHIPFRMKNNFIDKSKQHRFITFVRNPYDRFISSFFYKFPKGSIIDFERFIIEILPTYNFDLFYNPQIIHFYPQYLFLIDEVGEEWNIHNKIEIEKLEKLEKLEKSKNNNKLINLINLGHDFNIKKYNHSDYFSNKSIKIINNIYHKDFISFNYAKIQLISSKNNE
jgi:hypothetical protein